MAVTEADIPADYAPTPDDIARAQRSSSKTRGQQATKDERLAPHLWDKAELQLLRDNGATEDQINRIAESRMPVNEAWAEVGLSQIPAEEMKNWTVEGPQMGDYPGGIQTQAFVGLGPEPALAPESTYPGGYLDTLAIMDQLEAALPSEADLSYDAPTYGLDALGLPEVSEASLAGPDIYGRETQRATLDRLRAQLDETGLGAEDIAALERIQRQTEKARLTGGRAVTQRLGGARGGEQIRGDIELANALRMASTEEESDVVASMEGRTRAAAAGLGEYGAGLAKQVFGEELQTGGAADRLAMASAGATADWAGHQVELEDTAERVRAQAPLNRQKLARYPLDLKGQLAKGEVSVRQREDFLRLNVDQYNRSVAKQNGVGFWGWAEGIGLTVVGGVLMFVPGAQPVGAAAIAAGGLKIAENIEKELNPKPTVGGYKAGLTVEDDPEEFDYELDPYRQRGR